MIILLPSTLDFFLRQRFNYIFIIPAFMADKSIEMIELYSFGNFNLVLRFLDNEVIRTARTAKLHRQVRKQWKTSRA